MERVSPVLCSETISRRCCRADVLAACLDDHVAADLIAFACDNDLSRPAAQTGLLGPAARGDALDEDSLLRRELELLRDRAGDEAAEHAEQRVVDPATDLQLRDDLPHGVDRDREADAGVLALFPAPNSRPR